MLQTRLAHLSTSIRTANLDALALNPGPSLVYLTGLHFHLMERPTVAFFTADGVPVLVLPELEMLKLKDLPFEINAFPYGEDPAEWDQVFREAGRSLRLDGKRIGIEPLHMRIMELNKVKVIAGETECPDATQVVGQLRLCKDADEVAAMRAAVNVAQAALEATIPSIKVGETEKEIAAELVVNLLRLGSQSDMPFDPIVSSGPNSANPHSVPSDRKLRSGDLLVVDWGAAVDGYFSDLTRTFAVGKVDEDLRKIHQVVLEANAAGRAAVQPGLACDQVDGAARAVIEKAGYGQYFTHRTGHGIGMEPHEDPYIRSGNMQLLEPGMTFTIEPGIYLPGRNGVRIEDNMVITKNGAECLSDMPRDLRQVG
ncbi:MAG: Xaa-Pro peptidase family protein [Anaerolineales bacterium]|jgi:Xaa-Pro dipeptidase